MIGYRWRATVVAAALLCAIHASGAQDTAGTTRVRSPASVTGRVVTPNAKSELPVPGLTVTLHRVGRDTAGPVDSVRTGADGGYSIHYMRLDGDDAVFFAAAVYRGIAYFSAPIQTAHARGEEAEITVFDTTSKSVDFHVEGHHVVVSAPRPDGMRDVVEVWELSNDTTVTVISHDSLSPVWSTLLPVGATKITAGPGDVAKDAISVRGQRVRVMAPFGPGVKQLSYSYSLPSSRFPLTLAFDHPTGVFEVLLEEPLAQAAGTNLRATASVTKEGRTFKRFLAQNVPSGEHMKVTVPATTETTRTTVLYVLAAVIALAMIVALALALSSRSRRSVSPAAVVDNRTESLIAAIAQLDARHEAGDESLSADAYDTERSALKTELSAVLAHRSPS